MFIGTTTEDIESSLLLTFRRRIAMIISIPLLYKRVFTEKIDFKEILKNDDYLHLDKNKWMKNITDVFTISATNIIEFKQDSINFNEIEREVVMKK